MTSVQAGGVSHALHHSCEGCGARLCGTGPHAHLLYMGRMGGRYPLGVPVMPGRSSTPSRDAVIIQRAGNLILAEMRSSDNEIVAGLHSL